MTGPLIEVIDRLDELDDSDRFAPLAIYADDGSNALPTTRAIVCPGDEEGSLVCPQDPALSEVLMVQLAKEAIEAWSSWRGGRTPTRDDKFAAVMFYSRHDAYLPVEDAGGQTLGRSTIDTVLSHYLKFGTLHPEGIELLREVLGDV